MDLKIANAPDFKMTRGQQFIMHAASVEIWNAGKLAHKHLLSHFSLAMICRQIKELIAFEERDKPYLLLVTTKSTLKITLTLESRNVITDMIFRFPPGIPDKELIVIIRFIQKSFQNH